MLLNRLPLHLLPQRAVLLAADVVLLFLSDGERAEARFLSTTKPPYGTVEVSSVHGPSKIAAVRLPRNLIDNEHPPSPTADADPDLGLAPLLLGTDVTEMAEELDLASRRRLLSFLLGFCRKAFDLADRPDFASACLDLARRCVRADGQVEPIATVSPAWTVLDGFTVREDGSVFALNRKGVRRVVVLPVGDGARRCLVERVSSGDVLLALGNSPAMSTVAAQRAALPDLLRPNAAEAELRATCLRALVPISAAIAAQVRELSLLAPAVPIRHDDVRRPLGATLEAAIPTDDGRIFLRGWLRDPMQLVRSAELVGPCGNTPLELGELHRFRRPDIDRQYANAPFMDAGPQHGFVALLDDPAHGLSPQPTLLLHLHSGSRLPVRPPMRQLAAAAARTAVLTSVQSEDVTDAMLDHCIGPAAAALHRNSLSNRGQPDRIQIGAPIRNPTVSVIIPLYRNLSFLRFQISAFASDPDLRTAQFLFVLDSPEQRGEAEHLLRGLHAMHGMPMTLLVLPRNLGYAAANNAAAEQASAGELLLLNSDVVPAQPGWLSKLRHQLADVEVGAVGPKLLFDDGSLQHAGLYFDRDIEGVWFNAHYDKGMPRFWPAANRARRVPGVTGAALLVRRSLFDRVGGICEDYIIGDYEDSDFCLRLRATGAAIMYEPGAELFHFERRSIGLHKGYAGTLACRYNRLLHHGRWGAAMAELMSAPEYRIVSLAEAA